MRTVILGELRPETIGEKPEGKMAATGKVLGTVTSVVGEAKATAADGTVRVLQVGDIVHSDEVITTSAAGAINIALESGKTLDCGANTDLSLHESILGVATATAA